MIRPWEGGPKGGTDLLHTVYVPLKASDKLFISTKLKIAASIGHEIIKKNTWMSSTISNCSLDHWNKKCQQDEISQMFRWVKITLKLLYRGLAWNNFFLSNVLKLQLNTLHMDSFKNDAIISSSGGRNKVQISDIKEIGIAGHFVFPPPPREISGQIGNVWKYTKKERGAVCANCTMSLQCRTWWL